MDINAIKQRLNSLQSSGQKKEKVDYQVDVKGCTKKLCTHLVVCGEEARTVTCPSDTGGCDGYSADDCVTRSQMIEADFDLKSANP